MRSIASQSRRGQYAGDFLLEYPIDVVELVVESPLIGAAIGGEGVRFRESEGPDRIAAWVKCPSDMTELDDARRNLRPYAEANIPFGRRQIGVLELCAIAVPLVEGLVK